MQYCIAVHEPLPRMVSVRPSPLERHVSNSRLVPTMWEERNGHVKGVRQKVCGLGRQASEKPISHGLCGKQAHVACFIIQEQP